MDLTGITTKLIIAGVVLAVLGGAVAWWHTDIRNAVVSEFTADQAKEATKEQQDENAKLKRIDAVTDQVNTEKADGAKRLGSASEKITEFVGSIQTNELTAPVSPNVAKALNDLQRLGDDQ
jgi:hypothetical protein